MFFSSKVLAVAATLVASPTLTRSQTPSCPDFCSFDTTMAPLLGEDVEMDLGGSVGVVTISNFGEDGSTGATAASEDVIDHTSTNELTGLIRYDGIADSSCDDGVLLIFPSTTLDESLDGTWLVNDGDPGCDPLGDLILRLCYCPPTAAPTVTTAPSSGPSISHMPVVTSSPSVAPSTVGGDDEGDDEGDDCCCDDEGKASSLLDTIRSVFVVEP